MEDRLRVAAENSLSQREPMSWSSCWRLLWMPAIRRITSCSIPGFLLLRSWLPQKILALMPSQWSRKVPESALNTKESNSLSTKSLASAKRGRSKYPLSVKVIVGKDQKIPAKIVCVRNNRNKKDWIAFICTNPDLSEEEIIRIYGKRWQIEVFFKTCKSYLNLIGECHSLSYDALTAYVAVVFARYMMLALEQSIEFSRNNSHFWYGKF